MLLYVFDELRYILELVPAFVFHAADKPIVQKRVVVGLWVTQVVRKDRIWDGRESGEVLPLALRG